MKRVITYENLRSFAYSNDHLFAGPVRGIVVSFMGLNNRSMFTDEDAPARAQLLAKENIIFVIPYLDPWNWMNSQALHTVEDILLSLREHYGLPENVPVVSSGNSMGGLCALLYTLHASRAPIACVTNCPVCDLAGHYYERPDLPRTLYAAYGQWEADTLEEALKANSPLHQAEHMPDADYVIFHCGADSKVNIHAHSEQFVEKMKDGHCIRLHVVPERDHCDLGEEAENQYNQALIDAVKNA